MHSAPMTPPTADATHTPFDMDADYAAELAIAAAPDAVFDALTTLPGLAGWWTTVSGSGLAGGQLHFLFIDDTPLIMQVTAAERPATVRWTCLQGHPLPDWTGTTLSFDVQPRPAGGSTLTFRHTGLTPRLACYSDCKDGWEHFLPSLCAFVESGRGQPWGSPPERERREDRDIPDAARQDSLQGAMITT